MGGIPKKWAQNGAGPKMEKMGFLQGIYIMGAVFSVVFNQKSNKATLKVDRGHQRSFRVNKGQNQYVFKTGRVTYHFEGN